MIQIDLLAMTLMLTAQPSSPVAVVQSLSGIMVDFTHGESTLPELVLYQGHGYFSAFCTRVRQRYDFAVTFTFSSAFSISPDSTEDPAVVSDT